jgi:hypothetical protein
VTATIIISVVCIQIFGSFLPLDPIIDRRNIQVQISTSRAPFRDNFKLLGTPAASDPATVFWNAVVWPAAPRTGSCKFLLSSHNNAHLEFPSRTRISSKIWRPDHFVIRIYHSVFTLLDELMSGAFFRIALDDIIDALPTATKYGRNWYCPPQMIRYWNRIHLYIT